MADKETQTDDVQQAVDDLATDQASAATTDTAKQRQTQPEPKLVPEKDLLAVKSQLSDLTNRYKELEAKYQMVDTDYQRQKLALSELTSKASQVDSLNKELEAARGKLAASEKSREELQNTLLSSKRNTIKERYQLPDSILEGKSLSELSLLEQALQHVKPTSSAARGFDIGVTSGGPATPTSQHELDKLIIERLKQKSGQNSS